MKAGALRHLVSVQQRSATIDSVGDVSDSWTTLFSDHAEIRPLSGRELLAAQAIQSEITHQITVRYRTEYANPVSVTPLRVLFGARVFDITAVMNLDERNREVRMMAREGVSNG
jgi:SPP1 family predicted phage head-tail adaptor